MRRSAIISLMTAGGVFLALGVQWAQQPMEKSGRRFGGGDIVYPSPRAGPVLFRHESHVDRYGLGCNDCHPKIFKTKRQDLQITLEAHGQERYCGVCHNGKIGRRSAFSQSVESDCGKCHKKGETGK